MRLGPAALTLELALGWQVAQLFHSPVHQGPVTDSPRGNHLPGRPEFPGASQSTWLGEQIQSQLEPLLADPPPVLMGGDVGCAGGTDRCWPPPGRHPRRDLHPALPPPRSPDRRGFVLGKAYGLGRAITETALRPAGAMTEEERADQFRCVFEPGRLITVKDWLADLKTLLPDHTAHAVSRSLHDWQRWVAGDRQVGTGLRRGPRSGSRTASGASCSPARTGRLGGGGRAPAPAGRQEISRRRYLGGGTGARSGPRRPAAAP